uniref:Uncharacterized protein n=1 Tax=Ciona savignyi TaxID=51511 RepID=H2ZLS3_CIOSA
MARIGRLIKFLLDYNSPSEAEKSNEKSHIWQFLFFLLKIYFRLKQDNHVTRLLLRSTSGSEFEKRVLLKTLEEDATLAHLLLDFGVTVSGECVVKSVEHGHLDLVNRFKNDREILFSKEIEELLKIHPSVKNSSNRNMRRCLKLIKSQRGMFEEERRKFEAELLDDATITRNGSKKKKQKSKNKRNAPNIQLEIPEKLENSRENKPNAANIQLDIPEKLENSSKNRPDSAPNCERESDDTLVFNGELPKPGKRKRKNKKKN